MICFECNKSSLGCFCNNLVQIPIFDFIPNEIILHIFTFTFNTQFTNIVDNLKLRLVSKKVVFVIPIFYTKK